MLPSSYQSQDCSLARALEIVGERWTLLVIRDAFYGVRRFTDFRRHLDIPRAVLADRLQALVAHGLLSRDGATEDAHRATYTLTDRGRALWPALHALRSWGEEQAPAPGGARRLFTHVTCGTELDRSSVCPRCRQVVQSGDVVTAPGPGLQQPTRDDPITIALQAARRLDEPLDPRVPAAPAAPEGGAVSPATAKDGFQDPAPDSYATPATGSTARTAT